MPVPETPVSNRSLSPGLSSSPLGVALPPSGVDTQHLATGRGPWPMGARCAGITRDGVRGRGAGPDAVTVGLSEYRPTGVRSLRTSGRRKQQGSPRGRSEGRPYSCRSPYRGEVAMGRRCETESERRLASTRRRRSSPSRPRWDRGDPSSRRRTRRCVRQGAPRRRRGRLRLHRDLGAPLGGARDVRRVTSSLVRSHDPPPMDVHARPCTVTRRFSPRSPYNPR